MTSTEKRYESWAHRMTDWLAGRQDSIEEGTVIDLFKGRSHLHLLFVMPTFLLFTAASQQDLKGMTTATPLWQGLHVAAIAVEVCAFGQALSLYSSDTTLEICTGFCSLRHCLPVQEPERSTVQAYQAVSAASPRC